MYSRDKPSPRYGELAEIYAAMHRDGYERQVRGQVVRVEGERAFPGDQLPKYIAVIDTMIRQTGAKTLLDYGSGKGLQYSHPVQANGKTVAASLQEHWQLDRIVCYDPGVPDFAALPEDTFDAVISTDVLEHIPEEDVFWVVEEMFARAAKFVFCNIACYPAQARLPNGDNAHVTVKHPQWWCGAFRAIGARYPSIPFCLGLIGYAENLMGQPTRQLVYSHSFADLDL